MLGSLLCARQRPSTATSSSPALFSADRLDALRPLSPSSAGRFRRPCSSDHLQPPLPASSGGAASVWHVILPSARGELGGEAARLKKCVGGMRAGGSWNAACDVRPARWLHGSDSEWLLFGVRPCCSDVLFDLSSATEEAVDEEKPAPAEASQDSESSAADYRVTGVSADGRCLFRAIAHGNRLKNGEEAPDDAYEKELADDLRARVVEELLKRRKDIEWFMEGDFDEYVKNIQQPYSWGGEPELLMAAHVLQTPIFVFMKDRNSGRVEKIASYGLEYEQDGQIPIKVLFYHYGHYDVVEGIPD